MRERTLTSLLESLRKGDTSLCVDSRRVQPGDVFVAVPGSHVDGAQYIADALCAGATSVVCEAMPENFSDRFGDDQFFVLVENAAEALGLLAQAKYRTEVLPFPVIGVTGTNGKTTVTYLLEHLFRANGRKVGVLGTVSYRWPGHEEDASLTTPDVMHLHSMLASMREAGVEAVFMEVSSHALDQHRVAGVSFSGAVFTNLTQDHLDYHRTMDAYFEAKARLFSFVKPGGVMVINSDSPCGQRLLAAFPDAYGYGLQDEPSGAGRMVHGTVKESTPHGLTLHMRDADHEWAIQSPLIGAFNAQNLLAVQALGRSLGFSDEELACFADFCGVSGRLERIPVCHKGKPVHVFVDFAHTPDALENVLTALHQVGFENIITVFGCGGDRDRTKRPLMGAVVARLSSVAVLTSDNPRSEDPQAIINDVLPGLQGAAVKLVVEPDRLKAIELAIGLAIDMAQGDTVVLIAGKGHERTQYIGGVAHHFSDQEVVRAYACV